MSTVLDNMILDYTVAMSNIVAASTFASYM